MHGRRSQGEVGGRRGGDSAGSCSNGFCFTSSHNRPTKPTFKDEQRGKKRHIQIRSTNFFNVAPNMFGGTQFICRTLLYSKPWHIQNPRHFQYPLKHLQWSILPKQLMAIIIFESYNYFCNISFSRSLLYEINIINFIKIGLIFTPKVFILCKKVWGLRGLGALNFDITVFGINKTSFRLFVIQ